jgi:glycosyltransferase involved in cell wall biosynthesis
VIVGERFSQKAEAFDYERRLRAAALAFAGRIHFLGVRNDVNRILNELVLLVHAARQEPLGRVILEAAASGLPFVATDVGGTSEITPCVEFSELLIPPDDPSCLAAAMGRLLTDSALRERTSAQLRRRASDVFEGSAAAGRLLEHYRIVARET